MNPLTALLILSEITTLAIVVTMLTHLHRLSQQQQGGGKGAAVANGSGSFIHNEPNPSFRERNHG